MKTIIICLSLLVGFGLVVFQSGIVRLESNNTDSEESDISKIETIAYANFVPVGESGGKKGVVFHAQDLAYSAPTFYVSANQAKAYLLNMDGTEQHVWDPKIPGSIRWQYAELLKDKSILVVDKDQFLAKVSKNSELIWQLGGRYHHEVVLGINGNAYTLRRSERYIEDQGRVFPIVDDLIDQISPTGQIVKSISIYDLISNYVYKDLRDTAYSMAVEQKLVLKKLPTSYQGPRLGEDSKYDVLHTNAITPITRNVEGLFEKGDLIISVRNIDLVFVFNPETMQVKWQWGQGDLERQHHPTLLDNDNILIFDNRPKQKFSRIVEVSPRQNKIVWEFSSKKPRFFSFSRGAVQRLPNGNTLITESDKGKVFEITNQAEIVWEFYNPNITLNKQGKPSRRAAIYRMLRIVE